MPYGLSWLQNASSSRQKQLLRRAEFRAAYDRLVAAGVTAVVSLNQRYEPQLDRGRGGVGGERGDVCARFEQGGVSAALCRDDTTR